MQTRTLDYVDDHGMQWVMAACGHRWGGGVQVGQQIAACPNSHLILQVVGRVPVVYPERLPIDVTEGG